MTLFKKVRQTFFKVSTVVGFYKKGERLESILSSTEKAGIHSQGIGGQWVQVYYEEISGLGGIIASSY